MNHEPDAVSQPASRRHLWVVAYMLALAAVALAWHLLGFGSMYGQM